VCVLIFSTNLSKKLLILRMTERDIIINVHKASPRRHRYFDVVVGLAWSYDPESYAGGSLLLVGSPLPDRSKVMTQTKRDALALQVWGW